MEKQISRRVMLGLATATIGSVAALRAGAGEQAEHFPPEARSAHLEPERPYWEASYSGGPVHVTPLPPGRPTHWRVPPRPMATSRASARRCRATSGGRSWSVSARSGPTRRRRWAMPRSAPPRRPKRSGSAWRRNDGPHVNRASWSRSRALMCLPPRHRPRHPKAWRPRCRPPGRPVLQSPVPSQAEPSWSAGPIQPRS